MVVPTRESEPWKQKQADDEVRWRLPEEIVVPTLVSWEEQCAKIELLKQVKKRRKIWARSYRADYRPPKWREVCVGFGYAQDPIWIL